MTSKKLKIVYFTDPMCSTCYGFSPKFSELMGRLNDTVELKIKMGGLRPFNTQTMEHLSEFLHGEWNRVNEMSGQIFKHEILSDNCFIYDTEPSCRAVITMREMVPELAYSYLKFMQKAFYSENRKIINIDVLIELASHFDIDLEKFKENINSTRIKEITKKEFEYAKVMGVTSFPTIVLQKEGEVVEMAKGYRKSLELMTAIATEIMSRESFQEIDN